MGDRANVVIGSPFDDTPKVFLYTHWHGHELPVVLQTALKRKERWDDDQYLARIIFCEMVKGSEERETGFGITARLCDNGHPLLVVDCDTQMVHLVEQRGDSEPKWSEPLCGYNFHAFCELQLEDEHRSPWSVLLNEPAEA